MKGHLATQVNALIQSEKKPAGEAFHERQVEGEEHAAHAGGSQRERENKKNPRSSRIIHMHIGRGPSRLES